MKQVQLNNFTIGDQTGFVFIAGPCVLENETAAMEIAAYLKQLTSKLQIPFIFKASYDKANRTSIKAYRGPGMQDGLKILKNIKEKIGVPILSDVHRFEEIEAAAGVLDIMQVPAFLCRQTDFVVEIAKKAHIVNVKKGQFLAPWDVANVIEKIKAAGNENILVTERGASFGYNNLVFDVRSLPIMRAMGYPVIFDATHSVQLPGGAGTASSGQRDMVPYLARAAVAAGVDGVFMEVHPDPEKALCDGANSLYLNSLEELLTTLKEIDEITKKADDLKVTRGGARPKTEGKRIC
jgi:2-dehydro-3-deoxyphosphooctonate aldolase (KDO 8-P synthase)